jgi:hypothetical protein
MASLDALSEELKTWILCCNLDAADLATVSCLSSKWNQLANDEQVGLNPGVCPIRAQRVSLDLAKVAVEAFPSS